MAHVMDVKAAVAEGMDKAFQELVPKIEENKATVGGLNTALIKLLSNDQAMNTLINRFNPDSRTDNMTKVIETRDKRFSLSISTDKNSRNKVMLRENKGTVPEEHFYFLSILDTLKITDQNRNHLLKEIGFQDDGSSMVFSQERNAGLTHSAPTLEETILKNPSLLTEFTGEKFIEGFRALMAATPESANI